ncbi:MAG: discoidin domain-containing protein [Sedimentisphaerales bacterium]|jgi:hypothetical protein|nr:discoidin domain-containing protein [Sedimentisphaerales bacterium]HNY79044.1 discoidin domain-containing protein [Sedimentisphaerales bacterium]HOC64007.1 discoidin domain-containing protein [Sedimentisphaerales bacterium]HOH64958.1 discoidin domain-containing protein [Sedimentisphaerales bacterium]HPY52200.1 discoidin domain-containing protein [Sedimentisphaerales bacterium]
MGTLKYSLVAFALASVCVSASARVLYFEDFESFDAGVVLHERAGWEGWYGDAGAAGIVSDRYAFRGTKSVEIDASADAVQVLDITEGKWVLTAMQYIPSGTSGVTRFHMQNTYRDGDIGRSVQWFFSLSDGKIGDDYDPSASARIIYNEWIELKLVIDLDNDLLEQYYNGALFSTRAWVYSGTSQIQSIDLFGNGASSVYYDDIRIEDYLSSLVKAHDPSPQSDAVDVPRDAVLRWTAGRWADTHDVYFGTSADDVSNADRSSPLGVLVSTGQSEASFDPEGLLDFGLTYYWRIDEVNAGPDNAIFRGDVWNFTAEPFAYAVENIIATSNAASEAGAGPQNTVNGSGLDADDRHSTRSTDMWLGLPSGGEPVWIQYEFSRVVQLYELWVWNYNAEFELVLGFGIKNAMVEYSENGTDWTALGDKEFAQATAKATYPANTTVAFGGVPARYVRLTVNSGWGPMGQFGLSEVRFLYIPAHPRQPQPADGATDVAINATLSWRSGRQAVSHEVYLGNDPETLSPAGTVSSASFVPGDLQFASTYYWQVVEVNEADAVPAWAGDVWSFSTQEFALIDGFETYNDDVDAKTTIYDTWFDGWTNDTGSTVGYLNAPFAERKIVHGGRQSMPLAYDNSASPFYSEAERTFDRDQDWTAGGADSLSLYFQGSPTNSPQTLYLMLEDNAGHAATVSHGNPDAVLAAEWQQWRIPLDQFAGVDPSRIQKMAVGIGNRTSPTAGGTGIIYIDDIGYGRPAAAD